MFNWVTSDVLDVITRPDNKSADVNTPYVFNSEFFYRVIDNPDAERAKTYPLALVAQSSSPQTLKLRATKPAGVDFVNQSNGDGVLLVEGYDGDATSFNQSLVYYSVHTNRGYGYFANQSDGKQDIDFPTSSGQSCDVVRNAYEDGYIGTDDVTKYILYAYCDIVPDPNKDLVRIELLIDDIFDELIPKLEPAVDYLSMATELKASWVDINTIPTDRQDRYITQMATVPVYSQSNGVWAPNGTTQKQLALIGMHVVGSVQNHPEMIWSTYEHVDNAPNAEYAYVNTSGDIATASDLPSSSTWLLSNGTTTRANQETACLKGNGDIVPAASDANACTTSNTGTNTIGGTNIVRSFPWGNAPVSGSAPTSMTSEIEDTTSLISLNRSVQAAIRANKSDDPRQFYFLSGAVWGNPNDIPLFPGDNQPVPTDKLVGTHLIANTTMETFHQTADGGCFSCHAASTVSVKDGSDTPREVISGVSVSHIFADIDPNVPKPQN